MTAWSRRRDLVVAGAVLGMGLGGFLDGIVLHQILQWHNMLSSIVVPDDLIAMKYNMVWDGIFHLFTWSMTLVGVALLWRACRSGRDDLSTRALIGAMLLGWGLFDVVEGIVDHQVLGIHHVHPNVDELAWDLAFVVFGALLVLTGWRLVVVGCAEATEREQRFRPIPDQHDTRRKSWPRAEGGR